MAVSLYLRSIFPLNFLLLLMAGIVSSVRPDMNTLLSMISIAVLRTGHRKHFRDLGIVYICSIFFDMGYVFIYYVFDLWDPNNKIHQFAVGMIVLISFTKIFLATFLLRAQMSWTEHISDYMAGKNLVTASEKAAAARAAAEAAVSAEDRHAMISHEELSRKRDSGLL